MKRVFSLPRIPPFGLILSLCLLVLLGFLVPHTRLIFLVWERSFNRDSTLISSHFWRKVSAFFPSKMMQAMQNWLNSRYPLMHIHAPSGFMLGDDSRNVFIFSLIMFLIIISVQAAMLAAVCKCRLYLSCKEMHNTAMRVAERSVGFD